MGQLLQIGKASAQATAIDNAGAELPWLPSIVYARRGAIQRLMIEYYVVPVDVAQLVGIEVELPGRDAFLHIPAYSSAGMGRKIFTAVSDRRFRAPYVAVLVVEGREYRHIAKLSGVKIVLGVLVESIFGNGDVFRQL